MGTLDYERVTSEKVGTVFWLLDALAPLAIDRRTRQVLRRLRGAAQAARLHGRRATELLEAGRPASAQCSMAKLSVAQLMQQRGRVRRRAARPQRVAGGGDGDAALAVSRPFSGRPWRRRSPGGAAEIQRTVIARRELGFPPR